MMTPAEIARYEGIKRAFDSRDEVSREDFGWMMDNLTRYDLTITATQTLPT